MSKSNPFKWRHNPALKLSCVASAGTSVIRCHTAFVAEMVNERGLDVDHTTVFRWVQE